MSALAIPPIPQGNPAQITVTFTDINGNPVDPVSGIKVLVEDPNGGIQTYTYSPGAVLKTGVGVYSVEIELSLVGNYVARGQGLLANGMAVTSKDVIQPVTASGIAA